MSEQVLDNPIWEALASRHRALALREGEVARYPAQVAPFLGVPQAGLADEEALQALVPAGDTALVLGRAPAVSAHWRLTHLAELAQMICDAPVAPVDGPEIVALDESRREDVLALTALVYPHYFRPRTPELGRYFGIYQDGRLAAMIGERMGMDAYTEISAVCTHPDFNGRGYARRLLVYLSNDNHARGLTPFLHVSQENPRAVGLYEQNGYRLRREIPFWSLRRAET
ncbi:MAG: GNAT family N-acetyltransferase [Lysobacter sp.]|nr:GNAT family N-acetyltransferase [Lysobacter sp.]